MSNVRGWVYRLLRSSERFTKTDMVYLATSGFWLNLNVLIVAVLSFLLSVAFANLLPADVYGTYQYLLSFSTIVGAFTLTGMNYAVTTAVAKGHEGVVRESVRRQVLWSLVPCIGSCAIGGYYLYSGNTLLGTGLVVIGFLTPLTNAFNTYVAYLNGKKEFKRTFVYASILNACYYSAIFLCVLYAKEALWLLITNLLVNAVVIFWLYRATLRRYPPNAISDPDALSYGNHLSVMNSFSVAVRQMDALLIFHFLGPVTLAAYTFASTIPEKVAGLFKFLFFASLPKFATQSQSSIAQTIFPKLGLATVAGAAVAIAYFLAAPTLFAVLFPKYVGAVPYTQLYALIIITSAGNLTLSALIAQKLKVRLYIFNTLSPLFQFILQLVLLAMYGIWGILTARILASIFDILLSVSLLSYRTERHKAP